MKNEVREKLMKVGMKILKNSRNELYVAMHFLDAALSQLDYEMNLQTFFVGTDGWKLYYNPRFIMQKFEYNPVFINRAYLHMILHCIFTHMVPKNKVNEDIWNLSCDIAAEFLIDGLEYKATSLMNSDFRSQCYENLSNTLKVVTAEGIYREIQHKKYSKKELIKMELEFLVDDHSFWKKRDDNDDTKSQWSKPEEKKIQGIWKDIGERTKTNLETFAKDIGKEAGGFLMALNLEQRPRYQYSDFLRKFSVLRESIQLDDDAFDYIFYMYGLNLYKNMPLIESLESKEIEKIEEFVIAIDTSGSCAGHLVQNFLNETLSILLEKESFHKKVNIHIIQCDNKIQEDKVITSLDELEDYQKNFHAIGFGGTDFRPVFQYVDRLLDQKQIKVLKGMIYFTDGYGIFPRKRPGYDTAFVFIRNDYTDVMVPPWAMKIIIDEDLK